MPSFLLLVRGFRLSCCSPASQLVMASAGTPLRYTLRQSLAGSRPSRKVGERQVHAQRKNCYDIDQTNEYVKISCDLYVDQETNQQANDSKGHLTLRYRKPHPL
jgi:hypothetical protein